MCSIDNVLYITRGKCRERKCDRFYEVSTEFQCCCLIVHARLDIPSVAQTNQNVTKIYTDNLAFVSALVFSGNTVQFNYNSTHMCHFTCGCTWFFACEMPRCVNHYAKQKHPGCKKVRGQSEAALQIGMYDQKL